MNDLDRIEDALATRRLDATAFERCAQDLLTSLFPGLTPIPGGTDWGRDADVAGSGEPVPPRLVATSARTLDGVRQNMRRGVKSMQERSAWSTRLWSAEPGLAVWGLRSVRRWVMPGVRSSAEGTARAVRLVAESTPPRTRHRVPLSD